MKLAFFPPNSPLALELVRRLEVISIRAVVDTVQDHGVVSSEIVILAEPGDLSRALDVVHELNAEVTRQSCSCGYDLQGHEGMTVCPECGREVNATSSDVQCVSCYEEVPSHFTVCWACGVEMPGDGS